MDDVREWGKRPLEDIYPIASVDCMVLKIRDGGSVQRRALYLALGVTLDGDARRARACAAPRPRARSSGCRSSPTQAAPRPRHPDRSVDGLKGFPEAIEAIFPKTTVRRASCI